MNIYQPLDDVIPFGLQSAILASIVVLALGLAVRRRLADGGVLPDEGFTLRNVMEVLVEFLGDLGQTTIGDEWRKYFPIVGTIFIFIFVSNLMGLVPGLGGPTSEVNTTTAWAIIAFLVYNYVGIRAHGFKYIYKFMGPSLWEPQIGGKKWHIRLLAPFFLPLEIVLHFARILTLSVRLLANMFADHTVVALWITMLPIVVPAIFMGLGLMIAFLQAFVFSLLSMIYIGEALDEPH